MRAEVDDASALRAALDGVHNVLMLAPPLDATAEEACLALLSAGATGASDVIGVTLTRSPDARLEAWRAHGGLPDASRIGFVVTGEVVRSPTASTGETGSPLPSTAEPILAAVSSPADMTGLGIELGEFFAEWADHEARLTLCFHTLTTFLQYADVRSAFTFLHELAGRVRDLGGLAHYHLDPSAHDEMTVNAFLGLVDAAVEPATESGWRVSRRR